MGFLSKLKHHAQTLMGNHKEIIEETKSAADTAEKVVDTAKTVKKTAKKAKGLVKKKTKKKNVDFMSIPCDHLHNVRIKDAH